MNAKNNIKYYIFGEIVYEIDNNNNSKKDPREYQFFQKNFNIGPNQCEFLKELIHIVEDNKETILNGQMHHGKFEKLLLSQLTDNLIEHIAHNTTNITTMSKSQAEEEIEEKKRFYSNAREQFIEEIIEGYRLHQEAEKLQRE